jgi:hypothetical protein
MHIKDTKINVYHKIWLHSFVTKQWPWTYHYYKLTIWSSYLCTKHTFLQLS